MDALPCAASVTCEGCFASVKISSTGIERGECEVSKYAERQVYLERCFVTTLSGRFQRREFEYEVQLKLTDPPVILLAFSFHTPSSFLELHP